MIAISWRIGNRAVRIGQLKRADGLFVCQANVAILVGDCEHRPIDIDSR